MATFTYPATAIDTTGLATEAKQDVIITELQDVNLELDSQTTLLTNIEADTTTIAADTTAIEAKVSTEAKQDTQITELQAVNTELDGQTTILTSLDGKDFSTETTLSDLNSKVTAVDTTGKATEAKQDSIITELQDIEADIEAGNAAQATAANQATGNASLSAIESDITDLNARLAGSLVPETHDYLELTYVAAGNGAGEIETVTYRTGGAAGSIVATLTLTYDSSDRIASVTRS